MKKFAYLLTFSFVVISLCAFRPKTAEPTACMMVISNLSFGLNAQASIITIAPDGTQQTKELDFNRGSAKHLALNTAQVHMAALATINEFTRDGWHVVTTTPNTVSATGNTVFIQTIYLLEK